MENTKDSSKDYFNFQNPSRWVLPKSFKHRLGDFQTPGVGNRDIKFYPIDYKDYYPFPLVCVLHLPVANIKYKGQDLTAERTASYLANPGEKRSASINLTVDTDSFVTCLPLDCESWHCSNVNVHKVGIGVEIAGLGEGKDTYNNISGDAYWSTDEAIKKYRQVFKGLIAMYKLLTPEFTRYFVPLQKAQLDNSGKVIIPGYIQHREVPILLNRKWNTKDKNNQVQGQHTDLCANFPYDLFFKIGIEEINKTILEDAHGKSSR